MLSIKRLTNIMNRSTLRVRVGMSGLALAGLFSFLIYLLQSFYEKNVKQIITEANSTDFVSSILSGVRKKKSTEESH